MVGTQNYFDGDGLFRRYGTDKAIPSTGGEFKTFGATRDIEIKIDLTTLTTTAAIQDDCLFFPKNVWIESVDVEVDIAAATGTSVSIGLMQTDRTTTIDDAAILNAEVTATLTLGKKVIYDASTTHHGTLIGTTTTLPAYITAKSAGSTFTTGVLVVRIHYRPFI